MAGFIDNIEKSTLANHHFRKVLFTGQHTQLVLMSLKPKEEIGQEMHAIVDQFLRIEQGEGKVIIDKQEHTIKDGSAIIVPAGSQHNIINTSASESLKLYTLYSPPHHQDQIIHQTKADAEKDESDHI